MKIHTALTMAVALLIASEAQATTKSSIDPAAKEIASMMCRWVLSSGQLTEPAQLLAVYENSKNERWLELHPSEQGSMPPIVYKRHRVGGFVEGEKYKEYFWKDANFRLTIYRDALFRKGEVTLAVEDVDNATMPVSNGRCDKVTYTDNN